MNYASILLIMSVLTGLCTEAIKTALDALNKTYNSNLLSGAVALVIGLIIGVCGVIYTGATLSIGVVLGVLILMLLSWLCAMLGYDKIKQTLTLLATDETDSESEEVTE